MHRNDRPRATGDQARHVRSERSRKLRPFSEQANGFSQVLREALQSERASLEAIRSTFSEAAPRSLRLLTEKNIGTRYQTVAGDRTPTNTTLLCTYELHRMRGSRPRARRSASDRSRTRICRVISTTPYGRHRRNPCRGLRVPKSRSERSQAKRNHGVSAVGVAEPPRARSAR